MRNDRPLLIWHEQLGAFLADDVGAAVCVATAGVVKPWFPSRIEQFFLLYRSLTNISTGWPMLPLFMHQRLSCRITHDLGLIDRSATGTWHGALALAMHAHHSLDGRILLAERASPGDDVGGRGGDII